MKKILLMVVWDLLLPIPSFGQHDVDGCKDHPLLTRLENFFISDCEENYNELLLRLSSNETATKEGNLYHLYYRYNFDAGVKAKSALQIIRNYEVAITNNGGKLIYKNTNAMSADLEATYYFSTNGKEYWVQLASFAGTENAVEAFSLNVLEMEAMKQEVTASKMFEAISKDGFIALYINFETGKSAIKPESQSIIEQVAAMLNQNTALNVSIEGHTDNVGDSKSNQLLSEARAKSVLDALAAKGIASSRLKSKGWGQAKPMSDNNTEEGRAKNRRVEIVKL